MSLGKWLFVVVALLLIAALGFVLVGTQIGNPRIVEELRSTPDGIRADRVMLLHFPDGKMLPVNYLREGTQVFAGADGPWWRAFRAGDVPVTVEIRGERLSGKARVVLDDAQYTQQVFERLRPDTPEWLPDWLNGYLVVIDLEPRLPIQATD